MQKQAVWLCVACSLIPGLAAADYQIGDTVADFTVLDVAGEEVSLYDQSGRIILLNFFATWCPGCNAEAAILEQEIYQAYQADGVVVIALDILESAAVVQQWIDETGVTYPVWLCPDWSLFSQFPTAGGLPYNAVLDRGMVLRYAQVGFDPDELTVLIEEIIHGGVVADSPSSWGAVKALFR